MSLTCKRQKRTHSIPRVDAIADIIRSGPVYETIFGFLRLGDRHMMLTVSRWFRDVFIQSHPLYLPVETAKSELLFSLRVGDFCTLYKPNNKACALITKTTRYALYLQYQDSRGATKEHVFPRVNTQQWFDEVHCLLKPLDSEWWELGLRKFMKLQRIYAPLKIGGLKRQHTPSRFLG